MRYVTIAELSDMIRKDLWKIPHDIDLVVGIPRSGLMAANMIALYLNKRLSDIDSFIEGRVYACGDTRSCMVEYTTIKKVLIVDDSVGSGTTINKAKNKLIPHINDYEFLFYTPIATSYGIKHVDYYSEIIDDDRVFEWNIFHHLYVNETCMDMDGVLCCNPTEDDDGPKYVEFIKTAKPLFCPTTTIDTIITCRLEKYRYLTELWLRENDIKYNNLVMLNLPDKQSRTEWNKHGEYKGTYYKSSHNRLFIESSKCEASTIALISGKPVFCVETNEMIPPPTRILRKIKYKTLKKNFPRLYRLLKKYIRPLFEHLIKCMNITFSQK